MEINIKKINLDDLNRIAEIHLRTFSKDHFTSTFSKEFLIEYLTYIIKINNNSYLVKNNDDEVIGYIIGGNKTTYAVDNFFKKHFIKIIFITLKNPKFLLEKIIQFIHKYILKNIFESKYSYRILFIAIDENYKGKNIISKLLQYFEKELVNDNIFEYGLSVRNNNKRAIQFYEKNGFIIENKSELSYSYYKKLR